MTDDGYAGSLTSHEKIINSEQDLTQTLDFVTSEGGYETSTVNDDLPLYKDKYFMPTEENRENLNLFTNVMWTCHYASFHKVIENLGKMRKTRHLFEDNI